MTTGASEGTGVISRAWRIECRSYANRVRPMRIDINSDMGESFGAYTIGHDAGLMASITSANVAAGFHAGDPSVLRGDDSPREGARRRRRRASGVSRPRRLRPPRAERHAAGSRGHRAVSDRRGRRRRRRRGREDPARQAARRAVQHGGAQRGARGGDRARGRGLRQVADPVRPARIGNPERRPRRRTARRRRSVRRPRLRAATARSRPAASPARSSTTPPPSSRAPCAW